MQDESLAYGYLSGARQNLLIISGNNILHAHVPSRLTPGCFLLEFQV